MHGFPAVLTSFVGRDGPLREVAGLLSGHRLVTVTGPGGAGKTRLAGEVARRAAGRFADGAWLVELSPVRDPAHVAMTVAATLGVREQPGVPAAEAVTRVLARQQVLLVLDNCEHVIGAAAQLCAGLLAAADDLRVLATSREPLAVAGEARYRLGSLTLPVPGETGDAGSEAVTLFADRARRVDARFRLDRESGPAVGRLVARLDGMPLAIELAAARVESLGVSQLLDRFDDRFELLAGGDRLAPPRQRSLVATVEWSYQLLDETRRRVFRLVSVFPGPFTLEAARAVAGEAAGPAMLHLVDCSLLTPPRAGPDGRFRYSMLETLRDYGARLLAEAGEQDQAAAALAGWAAAVADEAGTGLRTRTGEADAARRLDAEDATMNQVLAWAPEHDPAVAVRLMDAVGWWWFLRGRLTGQYRMLGQAAGRARPGSGWWCAAQFWSGWAAMFSLERAAALGHFTALQDAVIGRPPCTALADGLIGRSVVLLNTGRLAEGAEDARRALVLSRELGYPLGQVMALANAGLAAWQQGDHQHAARLCREAGQITAGVPCLMTRSVSSYLLPGLLIDAGELAEAERVCAAGLAWSRGVGDLGNQAGQLPVMAQLEVQAGRLHDAAAHLNAALELAMRVGDFGELLHILDCLGHLCVAAGRHAEAVTVWSAHDAVKRQDEYSSMEQDHLQKPLRAAQQALGPARTRAAEQRGAAMSLATAAEYALLLTADPGPRESEEPGLGKLSARERELVTLVAQGRTNAEIASQLFISIRTVSSHLDRVRDKTGCRRRADLTRLALAAGLI